MVALDSADVESAETVAERIRKALPHKSPEELVIAPDCGMKYLPRDVAFAKLQALVEAARAVRSEVAAGRGRRRPGDRPARRPTAPSGPQVV